MNKLFGFDWSSAAPLIITSVALSPAFRSNVVIVSNVCYANMSSREMTFKWRCVCFDDRKPVSIRPLIAADAAADSVVAV